MFNERDPLHEQIRFLIKKKTKIFHKYLKDYENKAEQISSINLSGNNLNVLVITLISLPYLKLTDNNENFC